MSRPDQLIPQGDEFLHQVARPAGTGPERWESFHSSPQISRLCLQVAMWSIDHLPLLVSARFHTSKLVEILPDRNGDGQFRRGLCETGLSTLGT